MDNKALHDDFRQQFTNLHAITVLIVSLLEIVGYIVLVISQIEQFSFANAYLWHGVIVPIVINAATHFIARAVIAKPNVGREQKNQCIVTAALITSFVIAVLHREYNVTGCAFIFPMVLSAAFSDRKLLNTSFASSALILLCIGGAFAVDGAITLTHILNLLVLFGLAVISYLSGNIYINFSKQNYTAIESQVRQNNQLREKVRRDQMTGLYNHNTFIDHLEDTVANHSKPFCLAILDVDNFKDFNDSFGHDSGDTILVCLSRILQKHCAMEHTAYRYGGEEFTVIFNGKSEAEACALTENILAEFSRYNFLFTDVPITFSCGIAGFKPGMTRKTLFEAADQTLYRAKREGKNRIYTVNNSIRV